MPQPTATVPRVDDAELIDDSLPAELPARRFADPAVPITLDDLAARRGEAIEIIESRVLVLEIARKRGIRMTHPEDWVLFKSPDGRITGYLQDAGCERARDILGIEIFNVSTPQKIVSDDGQSFLYLQQADGRSSITKQVVEAMEGGRSSTEDFCKDDVGAALELKVRKACRANVDGNICRELMALKNVPLEELIEAWRGTPKNADHCRKGRGFGTQAERLGATREGVPDVAPPTCPTCKDAAGQPLPLVYRPGKDGKPAFYGCRNWDKHRNVKAIVNAADWVTQQQKAQRDVAQDARAQQDENAKLDAEIAAAETKNGRRDPGQEG